MIDDHNLQVKLWMDSLWLFETECLGYHRNDEVGWSELAEEHRALCDFLQNDPHKFKLILTPRGSIKSCLVTVGYGLWGMIRDPNLRTLIYSDVSNKAAAFLVDIKNHIVGGGTSSLFNEYFHGYQTTPKDGKWSESEILISQRTVTQKEPTFDTAGIETSKVGFHYDRIFYDDIVSDMNITSKEQMDKVYDCYKKSLSLLKPGGDVIMVGTRWAFGDAYGRIIEENNKTGEWGIFLRRAEIEVKGKKEYPYSVVGLTADYLTAQKNRIGTFLYGALYQNNPIDDTTAYFKHDDFQFYGKDVDFSKFFITCCVDPAAGGEDFTGITVVGTDSQMRMYLLYAKHAHFMPNQIIDEIIKLSYGYKFSKLGIETKIFNGMLEKELDFRLEKERLNPKFKQFGTEVFPATCRQGEGKIQRIRALQPYHERRAILFPGEKVEGLSGSYAELASQMLQWTDTHKPTHDDLLDSLSYHVKIIRAGQGEAGKPVPQDSILDIINRDRERYNTMQRRVPRRFRQYLEPVI